MCEHTRIRGRLRAQSLVEMAFVLPLLILAGAGVVQFSLWMHAEGIVTAWVLAGHSGAERFYEACGFSTGSGPAVYLELHLESTAAGPE